VNPETLGRQVGRRVESLVISTARFEEDAVATIMGVGLTMVGDGAFVFGCAGDGSVSIAKGHIEAMPIITGVVEASLLRCVRFEGGVLEDVQRQGAQLRLKSSQGVLDLVNYGDELQLWLDDERLDLTQHC
jgi:hypothetical protein